MKRLVLYPYQMYSSSCKKIHELLGGLRVWSNGKYKRKPNDVVINWGCSESPLWEDDRPILNPPKFTKVATNKLLCFRALDGKVPIPEYTTDQNVAKTWDVVVARKLLRANSGKGIKIWFREEDGLDNFPVAPLYVKYKKKRKEFRVHVFKGKVIGVREKRKPRAENRPLDFDTYIRSHLNGWIFCNDNIIEPVDLRNVAVLAVETLQLDFGAVDIIWNEKENKCYVLEVNTAPGIEGSTLDLYCNEIRQCLN